MGQMQRIGTHKTTVVEAYENLRVIFHQTVILNKTRLGIQLNNGGYYTSTTKARMNQASNEYGLGFGVFQKNFEWFVDYKGETLPYKNGMVLR